MEPKKYDSADLEKKRLIFLQIGFILVLAGALAAFEWATKIDTEPYPMAILDLEYEMQLPPLNILKEIKPPLPKEVQTDTLPSGGYYAAEKTVATNQQTQNKSTDTKTDTWDIAPTQIHEFPGGNDSLKTFLSENINYPEELRQQNVVGKVFVRFKVTKDGKIEEASIIRGIHQLLDAEALRVINSMPKWKVDNSRNTTPRDMWFTVPVTFK